MYQIVVIFFFNDTATTEIYTLSLHDALPISHSWKIAPPPTTREAECVRYADRIGYLSHDALDAVRAGVLQVADLDRKSTRLNSSHANISYAVFCLKIKRTKSYSQMQRTQRPY